ncbi:TPA: hypothetical protein ACFB66_001993 [Neisseria gonorrhoeae]
MEFEENGTKIAAEIGSAWHFLGAACRISINGNIMRVIGLFGLPKKPKARNNLTRAA